MTPTLREFQSSDVTQLSKAMRPVRSRTLFKAHCAYGKSHLAAHITRRASDAGWNVWVITPRTDLVDDLSARFCAWGIQHGVVADRSSYDWATGLSVQVMTTQSANRHRNMLLNWVDQGYMPKPHLMIFDECDEWLAFQQWMYARYPDARGLGLTATDGGTQKVYPAVVRGPTVTESTLARRLVPIFYFEGRPLDPAAYIQLENETEEEFNNRFFRVHRGQILGGFEEDYERLLTHRRVLVYAGEQGIGQGFTEWANRKGIRAFYVDADTPKERFREQILPAWLAQRGSLLVFPKKLGRGNDIPQADALVTICPTMSRTNCIQVTGRVMRTVADGAGNWLLDETGAELKPNAIFLDHAGWIQEHGTIYQEDIVSTPRNIKVLDVRGEKLSDQNRIERKARTRQCLNPTCRAVYDIIERKCPACGDVRTKPWKPAQLCTPEQFALLSPEAKLNAVEVIPAKTQALGFNPDNLEQKVAGKTKAQRRVIYLQLVDYYTANYNTYRAQHGHYPKTKQGKAKTPKGTAKGMYYGRFHEWPEFAWDSEEPIQYGDEVRYWIMGAETRKSAKADQKRDAETAPPKPKMPAPNEAQEVLLHGV
jgi:superfamily II DNA or RNA helicase